MLILWTLRILKDSVFKIYSLLIFLSLSIFYEKHDRKCLAGLFGHMRLRWLQLCLLGGQKVGCFAGAVFVEFS